MLNNKVSILVPVYGVEKYIERCAISLFEQTYDNIEYIFVNDCTKDNSIAILKDVINRYPNRGPHVHIIEHEQNKGLGEARNTAVAHATGEFVIHLDSDDYADVDMVRLLVERQREGNYDIVSGDIKVIRNTYEEVKKLPIYKTGDELCKNLLMRKIPVNIWGRLIRRSLYVNNGIKVEGGVNMSEDMNVIPRLSYYAHTVAFVKKTLFYYDCRNEASYTNVFSEEKTKQVWKTWDVLTDFFRNKEPEYIDCMKYGKMKTLSIQILESCKSGSHKEFFYYTKREQMKLGYKYTKTLDLPTRIAMYIPWYLLASMYIKMAVWAKHLIRKSL